MKLTQTNNCQCQRLDIVTSSLSLNYYGVCHWKFGSWKTITNRFCVKFVALTCVAQWENYCCQLRHPRFQSMRLTMTLICYFFYIDNIKKRDVESLRWW